MANLLPDGTTDFSGGQNSALDPASIKPNQYFYGVNVTAQRGNLGPRWGLIHKPLDFTPAGTYTRTSGVKVSFEEVFKSGKFQAIIPYTIGPDSFRIYIVSGFIFLISLQDFTVNVLNPDDQVNVYADRVHWSNAGEYLVIFDWPNRPFILDGIVIWRSREEDDEVPVSVMGTHNQNRLVIANAGIDWTAGDPAGNPATPRAPITFEEVIQPSTGFTGDVYQVPTANKNNDTITAMGFLSVLDKSTEIGSLLVATANAIYSYPTYLPRSQWQGGNENRVFGSLLLRTGIAGQRAHTNVNSDFLFLSPDGQIYTFTVSREQQFRWSNYPISREVESFLRFNDLSLAQFAALSYFKNKIFATCNPFRVDCYSSEGILQTDYVHAGIVVIEADNMASLSNETPPAWAGAWTGVHFMDFAQMNNQMYVAAKYRGRNELYLLDPNKTYDVVEGKTRLIRSVIVTKEYEQNDGTVNKKINSLDLGLRKLQNEIDVIVEYKPSTTETYNFWRHLKFNAPVNQCGTFPFYTQGLQAQGVRDLNTGGVDLEVCDPTNEVPMYVYKGVQIRLVITGLNWELQYIKLRSEVVPENTNNPFCNDFASVAVPNDCFDFWEIPEVDNC